MEMVKIDVKFRSNSGKISWASITLRVLNPTEGNAIIIRNAYSDEGDYTYENSIRFGVEFFYHKMQYALNLTGLCVDILERDWVFVDTTPAVVAFATVKALEKHFNVTTGVEYSNAGNGIFYFPH
jgi:hypothetical protein